MPLVIGTRLGPYEIVTPLGQGGQGEVYKARDTRLDRIVALKILPEHLASDPEFRARFDREARTISQLDHPHICSLYDVGEERGVAYLVMQYLEGETLAERLAALGRRAQGSGFGGLPVTEALSVAVQVASALDAAHRAGIVHRDLKPGNIMIVGADGRGGKASGLSIAKLLDFGLAKVAGRPGAGGAVEADSPLRLSALPTVAPDLTAPGAVLGTFQYMAPEQLEGREADARTDIFAFGAVLYEMLTGRKAFESRSQAGLISAIMTVEPPAVTTVQPTIPPALVRVVTKCLAKNPDARWQTARDLADELKWIGAAPESQSSTEPRSSASVRTWNRLWPAGAALAIVLAAAGWWQALQPITQLPKPLVRLDVDLGPDLSLDVQRGANVILSPDGTRLVYVSRGRLATRRLDEPGSTELPTTEGATGPFFSPDGQWVAFFAGGKLRKISVQGGAAITLCDAPTTSGGGGSWGDDGNLIAGLGTSAGLFRIPATGGTPAPVSELKPGELSHRWPQVLPGDKAVLFSANTRIGSWDMGTIDVISLVDGTRTTLVRGGTFGRYLASGHLVYVNGGTLFAVPFDPGTLTVGGIAVPVLEEVAYSTADGSAQFDFSQTGMFTYRTAGRAELFTVQWLDDKGTTQPLLEKPATYTRPRVSPDGQRLAIGLDGDTWVYQWAEDTLTRVTFEGGSGYAAWSPDGRSLIVRHPGGGMFWTRADGAAASQALTQSTLQQWPWSFTPDGRWLAFQEQGPGTAWDLWTLPVESDRGTLRAGKPEVFLQTAFDERNPSFSPDGRWLAYSSNELGLEQVYVRAFPDRGGKWVVSLEGGRQPEWSRTAPELFFRSEDNRIMVATYSAKGDSFQPGRPRAWSGRQLAGVHLNGMYDIAPGGRRIAALMSVEAPDAEARNHIVFLENFFDELRRVAPSAR